MPNCATCAGLRSAHGSTVSRGNEPGRGGRRGAIGGEAGGASGAGPDEHPAITSETNATNVMPARLLHLLIGLVQRFREAAGRAIAAAWEPETQRAALDLLVVGCRSEIC